MKKTLKRFIGALLSTSMLFSSTTVLTPVTVVAAQSVSFYAATDNIIADAVAAGAAIPAGTVVVDNDDIKLEVPVVEGQENGLNWGDDKNSPVTIDGVTYEGHLQTNGKNTANTKVTAADGTVLRDGNTRIGMTFTAKKAGTIKLAIKVNDGKTVALATGNVTDGFKAVAYAANAAGVVTGDGATLDHLDDNNNAFVTLAADLAEGDVVTFVGAGTNVPVYATYYDAVAEETTETTTEATTETTTEATTEEVTEPVTEAPVPVDGAESLLTDALAAKAPIAAGGTVAENDDVKVVVPVVEGQENGLNYTDDSSSPVTIDGKTYVDHFQTNGKNTANTTVVAADGTVLRDGNTRIGMTFTAKKAGALKLAIKVNDGKTVALATGDVASGFKAVSYAANAAGVVTGDGATLDHLDDGNNAFVLLEATLAEGDVVTFVGAGTNVPVYAAYYTAEGTTETTTEATTAAGADVESTTEATTEEQTAPVADTLTLGVNPEKSEVNVGDKFNVDVAVTGNSENIGFNNYTLFVEFDPTLVKPVSAKDGDITVAVNGTVYTASKADDITEQFANVPAEGNSDYEGADGTKTQAELGKVKVAYVINGDANENNVLKTFTGNGTLFSVEFEALAAGDANITVSPVNGVFEVVSSDAAVAKVVEVSSVESSVKINGSETSTTEATTEETTEETTEATTKGEIEVKEGEIALVPSVNKTVASIGDEVEVSFEVSGNDATKGFNNYTLFVDFDPAVLQPVSAEDGDITLDVNGTVYTASKADAIAEQFNNVPAAGNSDFAGADGEKTQAELGRIKVAYMIDADANVDNKLQSFTSNGKLFTIKFKALEKGSSDVQATAVSDSFGTVSSDATIASTLTVKTAPSETVNVDIVDTGFKFGGNEVEYVGKANDTVTVDFLKVDNPGWSGYGLFIEYDPTQVKAVSSADAMVNAQINHKPAAENPDYTGADGNKTCAELGKIKVAKYLADTNSVLVDNENGTEFSIVFEVLQTPPAGEKYTINVTPVGDAFYTVNGPVGVTLTPAYIVAQAEETSTTEATTEETSTETSTEASTETSTEAPSTTEATTAASTEASTETPSTDATTAASTEASTETPSTEVSTVAPTTEITTKVSPVITTEATTEATTTETTTRRHSSGGGGGGGGASGRIITSSTSTTEGTTSAVVEPDTEATTKATDSNKNVVSVDPSGRITITRPDGSVVTAKIPTDIVNPDVYFTDLAGYGWAEDAINNLAALGIVNGTAEGLFSPGLPCRRCDFAILINHTLGLDVTPTKNFDDNVDTSKYYYNDLKIGYTAGVLWGYGDNNYKPENYCTREEMFCLVARTLGYLGVDVDSTDLSILDQYDDVEAISWWSAPYCAFLTEAGIVTGTGNNVEPDRYINRAEMATMMYRDYQYTLNYINSLGMEAAAAEVDTEYTDDVNYENFGDDAASSEATEEVTEEVSEETTEVTTAAE